MAISSPLPLSHSSQTLQQQSPPTILRERERERESVNTNAVDKMETHISPADFNTIKNVIIDRFQLI